MNWNSIIKSRRANYASSSILIISISVIGSMSFYESIYCGVIDSTLVGRELESIYYYLFCFALTLFSFSYGAIGTSLFGLLPKFKAIDGAPKEAIQEHLIWSLMMFTGLSIVLILILIQ